MAGDRAGPGPVTVPVLPVDDLRAAIEAGDFSAADHLIAAHNHELVAALATADLGTGARPAWNDLLRNQREMLAELRTARDHCARELARFGNNQRGARAYLQQGAA